ncbi:vascular endothelial growth factor A-like [Macrosteles quadrilineatus]|uniref:vascular endothelial growth factor A-like n=1 Tax=Macrosteles quadrilineatus TaxID=74068 RepID=UPI0023E14ED9|nr:vascular endothelial growth factor A-like [Macrosteles quadrilineatus]
MVCVFACLFVILSLYHQINPTLAKLCKNCGRIEKIPMEVERYLSEIRDDDLLEQELNRFSSNKPLPFYNEASLPLPLYGIKPNDIAKLSDKNYFSGSCNLENQTISMREEGDHPDFNLYPECVRLERCGGCCFYAGVISCQPLKKENVSIEVRIAMKEDGKFKYYKVTRYREKHTKCNCLCRIKKEDCISRQKYDEKQCTCDCMNTKEMDKCRNENDKHWNIETCNCECAKQIECSSGTYQDPVTCRCVPEPKKNRNIIEDLSEQKPATNYFINKFSPNIFHNIIKYFKKQPKA